MNPFISTYRKLFKLHGPQGWWPLTSCQGYHPGQFDFPVTNDQRFEICVGSILTQNTSWLQVEKALNNLQKLKALNPQKMSQISDVQLKKAITPAGYFNQKAKKLRFFTAFFLDKKEIPKRDELLSLWGIGPETADSILLYAFSVPTFVVDAYTRRIFEKLELITDDLSYHQVQQIFEESVKREVQIYQEYHALIVQHAKRYYSKKPYGLDCPLFTE